MCDKYAVMLERRQCNVQEARHTEWPAVKVWVKRQSPATQADPWASLFRDPERRQQFTNLLHVIEIILVLPMSTATVEHGFSTMKRVKTDWRSKLSVDMLNTLMSISIDGPDVSAYEAARALDRWWTSGDKSRCPGFCFANV